MSLEERHSLLVLFSEAVSNGARREAAAEALGLPIRSLQRWEKSPSKRDGRKGSARHVEHKLSDEERQQILRIANEPRFRNLSPCKIVPALADEGEFIASESTFYRVLKQENQLKHRAKDKPARQYTKPAPLTATGPNQVWTWDITYLPSTTKGIYFYLYMHVDIYSRKIVGAEVHVAENSEIAACLLQKIMLAAKVKPQSLHLHSDNGAAMKGSTMLITLQHLGVIPSFSRPSVSDDNPFSEALFRTLKYHPAYPERPFKDLEDARKWVEKFVNWYNEEHMHSGIKYVTPNARHERLDVQQLAQREHVYATARLKKPIRWKTKTRDWSHIDKVTLLARKEEPQERKLA